MGILAPDGRSRVGGLGQEGSGCQTFSQVANQHIKLTPLTRGPFEEFRRMIDMKSLSEHMSEDQDSECLTFLETLAYWRTSQEARLYL